MKKLSRRNLAAGVIDAGTASMAAFLAGLTGVRLLSDTDRGVYGVYFTAFFLGTVIISELILVPAQVVAVDLPKETRLHVTRRSLQLALIPAILAITVALAPAVLTGSLTSASVIFALTATTAVTIVVSPMQDHVRQLLHIAGRSWHAVVVSVVQFLGVAVAAGLLYVADVERAWIPFGSLAIANIFSLTVGVLLAGAFSKVVDPAALTFRGLVYSGKWLVVRAATPAAFAFVAANILTQLAGPEEYGYAEAARQVAQPITVLAVGLMAILGPRAVRAGSRADREAGARNRRSYIVLMFLGVAAYSLLVGFDWALNPMAWLVPAAYTVGGLVIVTVAANLFVGMFMIIARELLGAGHARPLAIISMAAAPALPLAAATATSTRAFARPLGYLVEGVLRVATAAWWLRRHYEKKSAMLPSETAAAAVTSEGSADD